MVNLITSRDSGMVSKLLFEAPTKSSQAATAAIQRGINKAVEAIVAELAKISKKVSDRTEIAQVATVSANWDRTIGEIIADAMDKVGKDGTITVEEAKSIETSLDVVEGMQFDKGYLSPYMITDAERMEAVLEDPYILVANQKIGAVKDVLPVLEQVIQAGRPLPIVAEENDRVLVDATAFLLTDTEIVPVLKQARLGDWKQDVARSSLSLVRSGAFPRNTELEVLVTLTSENPPRAIASVLPDRHTMTLTVHHTFLKLPDPGFAPRPLERLGSPRIPVDRVIGVLEEVGARLVGEAVRHDRRLR